MAPANAQLTQQLRHFIWYHLDNDLVDNALFLAGRLHSLDPRNADAVHILALCHFRAGQHKIAYDYTKPVWQRKDHAGCVYVFAQACLGLGKHAEGAAALDRTRASWESRAPLGKTDPNRRPTPDAAAFLCVLGKLAHGNGDRQKAIDSYVAALKLNPLMWDAYERLCDLGASIKPANVFKEGHLPAAFLMAFDTAPPPRPPPQLSSQSDPSQAHARPAPHIEVSQPIDIFNPTRPVVETALGAGEINVQHKPNSAAASNAPTSQASLMETPPSLATDDMALNHYGFRANQASVAEPPMAPLRKSRLQTSNSESQTGADVAKLRSTTARPRTKEPSTEPADMQEPKKNSLMPPRNSKRTISGNDPNARATNPYMDLGQRRSVRLTKKTSTVPPSEGEPDHKKVKATGTRGRTAASTTVGRVVSGNRKPLEHTAADNAKEARMQATNPANNHTTAVAPTKAVPTDVPMPQRSRTHISKDVDTTSALSQLINMMRPLAQAYYELSKYNPQQALSILNALSLQQRETPYVLSLMGRAHHDLNAHATASAHFTRLRKLVPAQTQYMDIFSISLWHLKSDTEMAFLSHELIESARLAPQSWCALGNSFSLQRDHDNAIKCFRRATQLNTKSAYAWTLLGHEYVAAEDLEKASQCYRKAVAADKRHYQGWYGLARVYERLSRLDLAERHYRLASNINPRNAVLLCCIGGIQDRLGQHADAIGTYKQAVELAPNGATGRFKYARSLLRMRNFEEALDEFLVLKDLAPEEANVHFMLGRTYRALGRKGDAVRCLSGALGLDPKAAPLIKEAMEALGEEDEEMGDADDDDDMD